MYFLDLPRELLIEILSYNILPYTISVCSELRYIEELVNIDRKDRIIRYSRSIDTMIRDLDMDTILFCTRYMVNYMSSEGFVIIEKDGEMMDSDSITIENMSFCLSKLVSMGYKHIATDLVNAYQYNILPCDIDVVAIVADYDLLKSLHYRHNGRWSIATLLNAVRHDNILLAKRIIENEHVSISSILSHSFNREDKIVLTILSRLSIYLEEQHLRDICTIYHHNDEIASLLLKQGLNEIDIIMSCIAHGHCTQDRFSDILDKYNSGIQENIDRLIQHSADNGVAFPIRMLHQKGYHLPVENLISAMESIIIDEE
jgi:hypothetical protein